MRYPKPLDAPANSETNTIMNATAIPVRIPAIVNGKAAGNTTSRKIFTDDLVSNFALHKKARGICLAPMCVFIQTGKKTEKAMEKIFALSSMPNHTMTSGIIATGGKGRKIWIMGESAVARDLILPVASPKITPKNEPINSPARSRHKLSRKSVNKVPAVIIPQRAAATLEGGGKSAGLTKPLREITSHSPRLTAIGKINHKNLFINWDCRTTVIPHPDAGSHPAGDQTVGGQVPTPIRHLDRVPPRGEWRDLTPWGIQRVRSIGPAFAEATAGRRARDDIALVTGFRLRGRNDNAIYFPFFYSLKL